jgi:hypothetical protein
VVVINFGDAAKSVEVTLPQGSAGELQEYFTGEAARPSDGKISLHLRPFDYRVFLPMKKAGEK